MGEEFCSGWKRNEDVEGVSCDDRQMAVAERMMLLLFFSVISLMRQQAAQILYNDVTIKNDIRSNERLWQVQSKAKLFFCQRV
eukprot:scaffold5663_cov96-Skeletonema_dohrnii-CCMP3373.AAC.2